MKDHMIRTTSKNQRIPNAPERIKQLEREICEMTGKESFTPYRDPDCSDGIYIGFLEQIIAEHQTCTSNKKSSLFQRRDRASSP